MLRLILRQLAKHRGPILALVVVWSILGYFIVSYRHVWFSAIARSLVDLPEPGTQDPVRAYSYVDAALERNRDEGIELDLMIQACEDFLPYSYHGDVAAFRPHWLEKLEHWRLHEQPTDEEVGLDYQAVEPDLYWQEHRESVLSGVRDLSNALDYAYEIEPGDLGETEGQNILVAALFERFARAVCQEEQGRLAWGDYVSFQEDRAWRTVRSRNPDIDPQTVQPATRRRLILEQLRGQDRYEDALRHYAAGSPPTQGDLSVCRDGVFRLVCVAPLETIEVYEKLLAVSVSEQVPRYHLDLGRTYLVQARYGEPEQKQARIELARDHFLVAATSRQTEQDARLELIRLYLAERDYASAYEELRQLQLFSRQPGFQLDEYRRLARTTLMGMGRHADADCFAEMSDLSYGPRPHCENLQL